MFDSNDPRSRLAGGVAPQDSGAFAAAEYVRFYDIDPQQRDVNGSTWLARGQNFVVAVSETGPGASLRRQDQPDEYVLILEHKDTTVTVSAAGETVDIPGYSITMVPPGDSDVSVPNGGRVIRLFTTESPDLAEACANAAAYASPHPNIPSFEPWPEPPEGYRIRSYSLDVPRQKGRFGRIWRCTTFMVNIFEPFVGPRDDTALSPHHHDDFEQCSLALEGTYMHHIRWPWTKDMAAWREDDHELCGSPSVCVIPPPSIHTSRWLDEGENRLVDIFSPPRLDFSQQEGWVLNADDYPMPSGV